MRASMTHSASFVSRASEASEHPTSGVWRNWAGILSMALLIVSWVVQSELAQYVQTDSFQKPMFIVWYNHSVMAIMLPAQLLWSHLRGGDSLFSSLEAVGLTAPQLLLRSLVLCFIYTVGDYLWYIALGPNRTSVSAATCVFNTSCIFTYGFSIVFLGERRDSLKLFGMALAVSGAMLTALYPGDNNSSDSSNESTADQFDWLVLVLLAAAGYGLYEVLFSRFTYQTDNIVAVNYISGILGAVNLCVFWVMLLPLNFIHNCHNGEASKLEVCSFAEEMGLPPSARSWGLLNANVACALMFNVFFLIAISTTSPLLVSVGSMLSIPATAVADLILYDDKKGYMFVIGALLVVLGFAFLAYGDHRQQNASKNEEPLLIEEIERDLVQENHCLNGFETSKHASNH